MQTWTQMNKNWDQGDILPAGTLNTLENNLEHLKEIPSSGFDLSGRLGFEETTTESMNMFYAVKRLAARSTLYLKEVSKCNPRPDGQLQYPILWISVASFSTYPTNDNLQWHVQPDPTDAYLRWEGTQSPHTYIEHYYYENLGLAIVTNPLYESAYLEIKGNMRSLALSKHNPENMLHMNFHIGYNDI